MRIPCVLLAILVAAASAFAQPGRPTMGRGFPGPGPMGTGDFAFIRGEFGVANKVVQGAPYTAQAVTQFTRTLVDGNRIQRTSTAAVARDSEGRTRREFTLEAIGPLAAARSRGGFKAVFISDPVAGVSYVLDPNARTFRQRPIALRGGRAQQEAQGSSGPQSERFAVRRNAAGTVKNEDLGAQVIQGVTAQGHRVTRTIPAGQAGNQLPIDVVTETWYSSDLQAVVMSKTSDPRFGETSYQLTNLTRAEPDHALFVAPADYAPRERGSNRSVAQ